MLGGDIGDECTVPNVQYLSNIKSNHFFTEEKVFNHESKQLFPAYNINGVFLTHS